MEKKQFPNKFINKYNNQLEQLLKNPDGFEIFEKISLETGQHPTNYTDYECEFATQHIKKHKPNGILNIGSYRHFILGLLSHYPVTTIDIRKIESPLENETIITNDVKKLNLPSNSFDMVISLCTLEHLGLGRYGDEFDLDADKKAFDEMTRLLKPNGHLIFSTHITQGNPSIVFNTHRIYNHKMIKTFCSDLICEDEKFYSRSLKKHCTLKRVTSSQKHWDVYCGCWRKK